MGWQQGEKTARAFAKIKDRGGYACRLRLETLEARCLPSVNVLSYHNDSGLTGQNLNETILTPANVNPNQFGLLYTEPVDGNVYAQPLYLSGVSVPNQGVHDIVFVATEHDSVYAFDADAAAAPLWHDSFINPSAGITSVPSTDLNTGAITPEIGITSTPVIDPTTGTMYVVAVTKEVSGGAASYVQRLHALDVTTGAEKFGGPVVIQGSVAGSGSGSSNGVVTFDPRIQLQRPGLVLVNGVVYVAWGSYDDQFAYHGWVMGFNAQTLQRTAIWNATPNGSGGGIWQSGGGIAADSQGDLYVTIGNGTFDVNTGGADYGDSVVKLSTVGGGLTVSNYFTPYNQATLQARDLDLGSGAPMLLPDQPGNDPQLLTTAGKQGTIYLLNREGLGGFNSTSDQIVESIPPANSYNGNFSTPAYFNGTVYYHESADYLKAFQLTNGLFSTTPNSQSQTSFNFPGTTPSISANGTSNGIVWEWQFANPGVLHAYDASNVAHELYNSSQAGLRDVAGAGVKFAVPTIANGHVFVGTQSGLAVFGLFPSAAAPPAAPTNLTALAASANQINLSWTSVATDQYGFSILRSVDNLNFAQINMVPGGVTSYSDTAVSSSTTYYYRVIAINTAGESAPSNTATSTTPAAQAPDPSLVGYWKLDEGSGTVAGDASGNNDNGTIIDEVSWISGMVGPGALSFHGIGNQNPHVDIPDNPVLRFSATQSFTVAAWVDPYSLPGHWEGIVAKSRDVPPIYGIWIDPNNNWVFGGSSSGPGGGNLVGSPASVGWHYIAAVQDGTLGTRTLYVDGVAEVTGPALPANGTGDLWIGGANAPDSEFFDGAIDDVRIYSRALSGSEIQSIAPALAASYSSNPPTLWAAGGTLNYTITIKNVGTQTWNATGSQIVRLGVEFGTTSDYPGDGWATDQRFFLPNDVAPGGSVTLGVSVTAPTAGGDYILRHRMVKETVAWFNQIQKTGVVVDATPPTVTAVSPPDGSTGVAGQAAITATFSEALNPNSLNSATVFLTAQGSTSPLTASLAYDPSTYAITLTPTTPLATNANTYVVTVKGGPSGVTDLAGNPLAADRTWSFTTIDNTPPTVTAVTPAGGSTGILTTAVITATFSDPIATSTLTSNSFFLVRDGTTTSIAATITYDAANRIATLRPSTPLATGALYHATLKGGSSGITDLAGNPLASDNSWSFTTTSTPAYAAAFISESVPTAMVAGQSYVVAVTMKDTGTNAWSWAGSYKLGSWNPRDNSIWGVNRVLLPYGGSVLPGSQWTFTFTVKAPSVTGKYSFQWRMLQENVIWFGSSSPNIAITVSAGPASAAIVPGALMPALEPRAGDRVAKTDEATREPASVAATAPAPSENAAEWLLAHDVYFMTNRTRRNLSPRPVQWAAVRASRQLRNPDELGWNFTEEEPW